MHDTRVRRVRGRTVTLAIMLLLAVVTVIVVETAGRRNERALTGSCNGRMKLIWVASSQYEDKHGVSPFTLATDVDSLIELLIDSGFLHPSNRETLKCNGTYAYVLCDPPEKHDDGQGVWPYEIMSEPEHNSHPSCGRNILFSDGHVELKR